MAVGRYPLPIPTLGDIDEEMKLPPAGSIPPREGGNSGYGKPSGLSHFALMAHICKDVGDTHTHMHRHTHTCASLPSLQEPPQLPEKYFDADIREFVSLW